MSVCARAEASQLRKRRSAPPVYETTYVAGDIRRGLLSIVVGILVTAGGYLVATTYGNGSVLILYGPPIAGVVVMLRGLAALFPRNVSR